MNGLPVIANRTLAALLTSGLVLASCGGQSEKDLLASAGKYLQGKDEKSAIVQLKAVLGQNPDSGEARFLMGRALLAARDPFGALTELQRARDLKYDDNRVAPLMAEALLASGQAKKVIEQFEATVLSDPQAAADLKALIAGAYTIQGDASAADAAVSAALKLNPKNLRARVLEARAKGAGGAVDEALTMVRAILADEPKRREPLHLMADLLALGKGDLEAANKVYRQILVDDPGDMAARTALITILQQRGDFQEFKNQVAILKKAAPSSIDTLYYEVQLALSEQDLKRANEIMAKLLNGARENARVVQLAGVVAFRSGALIQAEKHFSKVIILLPEFHLARRLLAETQLRSGEGARAIATLQPLLQGDRPDAEALALAGEAYLEAGNLAAAEAHFARASKASPADPAAPTALALIQIRKGDSAAGLSQLEAVATRDRGVVADMALISALLNRGKSDAALAAIDKLQVKLPKRPLPYTLRARILLQRKDLAGARSEFAKALAADGTHFPAVAGMAAVDLAEKKPDDARKRFEDVLAREPANARALAAVVELKRRGGGKPEEIAALLNKGVERNPTDPVLRQLLIEHFFMQRDAAAALSAAQGAVAALPGDPQLLMALGRAQLAKGSAQEAVSAFKKAAAILSKSPDPELLLANAYMVTGDLASAEQSFRRALKIAPGVVAAQRGLIQLALAQKRPEMALKVAQSIQKDRPTEAAGYIIEAEIHTRGRQWDAAIAALRTALLKGKSTEVAIRLHMLYHSAGRQPEADRFAETWLKNPPPVDTRFLNHLAGLATDQKDLARAEKLYRQVIEARSDDIVALNNIATVMVGQKKQGGVQFAERAQRLKPEEPAIMDTLASALAEENKLDLALEWQRKAVGAAPNVPLLRLNLAKLLIKKGDKPAARAELEKLSGLRDKFSSHAEVLALLRGL